MQKALSSTLYPHLHRLEDPVYRSIGLGHGNGGLNALGSVIEDHVAYLLCQMLDKIAPVVLDEFLNKRIQFCVVRRIFEPVCLTVNSWPFSFSSGRTPVCPKKSMFLRVMTSILLPCENVIRIDRHVASVQLLAGVLDVVHAHDGSAGRYRGAGKSYGDVVYVLAVYAFR